MDLIHTAGRTLGRIARAVFNFPGRHRREIDRLTHENAYLKSDIAFHKSYSGNEIARLQGEVSRLRQMYITSQADLHTAKQARLESWKESGQ